MVMTLHESARIADRHAERILQLVRGNYPESANEVLVRSWGRCLNEYQLDPCKPREPAIVSAAELEQARARRADVIRCARYEMTTLYQQLADMETAVVL